MYYVKRIIVLLLLTALLFSSTAVSPDFSLAKTNSQKTTKKKSKKCKASKKKGKKKSKKCKKNKKPETPSSVPSKNKEAVSSGEAIVNDWDYAGNLAVDFVDADPTLQSYLQALGTTVSNIIVNDKTKVVDESGSEADLNTICLTSSVNLQLVKQSNGTLYAKKITGIGEDAFGCVDEDTPES